jgi:hypothetical protein
MRISSATISLFAEPSVTPRGPGALLLSAVAHGVVFGTLYYGVSHLPRIDDRSLRASYSVRQLDLHTINPPASEAQGPPAAPPDFYPDAKALSSLGVPQELREAMRSFLQTAHGRQTLIQPEFHAHLSLAEQVPLPTVVIWTPGLASGKKIVAPKPEHVAADVKPSLEMPNEEVRPADFSVASTNVPSRSDALPAATTSLVQARSVSPVEMAPVTTSDSTEQATPAAVLSLSDLRMQDGTVWLPPVNEMAPSAASPATPDNQENPRAPVGNLAGDPHQSPASAALGGAGSEDGSRPRSSLNVPNAGAAQGDDDSADDNRFTTEHIVLPKDGRFGVIVVGNSVGEEYPEALEIWSNRVAYTAYLHVALGKNWILQYSSLRSGEAADGGTVARLEAPWPYDIVRPNLISRNLNAEALMVHGVLTAAGRLESLAIAFPTGFRYSSFVLYTLRQWQFRPARRNGQATAVEVLLIIPDEAE